MRTLLLALLCAVALGCTPPAPVDGGVAVTPSGWTSTARVVLDTLRWAIPAARAITDAMPSVVRTAWCTTRAATRGSSARSAFISPGVSPSSSR